MKNKSQVDPTAIFILNDKTVNFHRNLAPDVILDNGEYKVTPNNLWSDACQAVARLQVCNAPCLGKNSLHEWIAACLNVTEEKMKRTRKRKWKRKEEETVEEKEEEKEDTVGLDFELCVNHEEMKEEIFPRKGVQ